MKKIVYSFIFILSFTFAIELSAFVAPENVTPPSTTPMPSESNRVVPRQDLNHYLNEQKRPTMPAPTPKAQDLVVIPKEKPVRIKIMEVPAGVYNTETCKKESRVFAASRDHSWYKFGLDTSIHPEVISYKIQWFNGLWTKEYFPGLNDIDHKKNMPEGKYPNNGQRRMWSYFYDHNYELTSCVEYFDYIDNNFGDSIGSKNIISTSGSIKKIPTETKRTPREEFQENLSGVGRKISNSFDRVGYALGTLLKLALRDLS